VTGQKVSFTGKMVPMGPLVRTDFQIPSEAESPLESDALPQASSDELPCTSHTDNQNQ
jgi:hypothetical protein